tara:strand:- start:660 stop:1472 length:813 start_codon:yes stop_codon:yes gene_type:complete
MQKVALLLTLSFLFSQAPSFDEGVDYYNNRSEHSIGSVTDDQNILKAINIFESQLDSNRDLEAAIYLVKSYYYMAQYVLQEFEDKRLYFELAKDLSEKYIIKYPESVEVLYWNLANMSNWAKLVGLRAISKLGGAEEYRERAVDIILMDPEYENGGGYFLLGAVYYTAPNIPIILTWPNNDKAIQYFTKAVSTGKSTPLQLLYLSKALLDGDYYDRAKIYLSKLISMDPTSENYIEDLNYIIEAKSIWDTYFKEGVAPQRRNVGGLGNPN